MEIVTTAQITRFRSELANYPEALESLDVIAECGGDLESATKVLAMQKGEEIDTRADSHYLDSWVQKCRDVICKEALKETAPIAVDALYAVVLAYLVETTPTLIVLATPIVFCVFRTYLVKNKMEELCKSTQSLDSES